MEGLVPGDFYPFHLVGRRVLSGETIYNINDVSPFKYSPAFALAMVSIAKLSKGLAWWIWCVGSTAVFLWATFYLIKSSKFFELARPKMFAIGGVALLSAWHGIIEHQSYGQADMLIFGLFVFSVLKSGESNRSSAVVSGLLLACCWLTKPPSLVLGAYFLIRREYRTLLWASIFTTTLFILPVIYWGPTAYLGLLQDWRTVLVTRQPADFLTGNLNQSIAATLSRWFGARESFALFLKLGIAGAVATTLALWARRARPSLAIAASFTYLLYMAVTPLSWRWMTCAWLPLAIVAFSELDWRKPRSMIFLTLYAALALFLQAIIARLFGVHEPDWLSAWGLYTVGTVMLLTIAFFRLVGQRAPI